MDPVCTHARLRWKKSEEERWAKVLLGVSSHLWRRMEHDWNVDKEEMTGKQLPRSRNVIWVETSLLLTHVALTSECQLRSIMCLCATLTLDCQSNTIHPNAAALDETRRHWNNHCCHTIILQTSSVVTEHSHIVKAPHRDPPDPINWENIFSAFGFYLLGKGGLFT